MDFDSSKENIQPLRGGRNAAQLEVALQAQNSQEYQQELLQQKEQFENAIRNYTGDDPLDNWYHYISWVEQSFPKHGHEGNLVALLESCLQKFEDDKHYANDRRLCKLWIKYNDLQQNPIELYQMLHAKDRCTGCTDFYKAWAFYHEAAGNFQQADHVFKLGIQALAQPYEELILAHNNMIFAAGQQLISGRDERRLEEQRLALTCLKTYKQGKVGSIRTSSTASYTVPNSVNFNKPNSVIPVFENSGEGSSRAEAAPVSVLNIARQSTAPKENAFKPGVWTTVSSKRKTAPTHSSLGFTVHEDEVEIEGLKKPPNFSPVTYEDFSGFILPLFYPDPINPNVTVIPMYPKALVYGEPNKEYSLEEIRARKYLKRPSNSLNVPHCETQQAVQSILIETPVHRQIVQQSGGSFHSPNYQNQIPLVNQSQAVNDEDESKRKVFGQHHSSYAQQGLIANQPVQVLSPQVQNLFTTDTSAFASPIIQHPPVFASPSSNPHCNNNSEAFRMKSLWMPSGESPAHKLDPGLHCNNSEFLKVKELWMSTSESPAHVVDASAPAKREPNFIIFEEPSNVMQMRPEPKGSAMKTPFKHMTDEDLAETGSRGGLDVAAAAQPVDSAKNLFSGDESNSSFGDGDFLMNNTNTQVFNFNLNAMQVSTPQSKNFQDVQVANEQTKSTKKQLFQEPQKGLSTIFEETKSSGSSSGSSLSAMKTSFIHSKKNAIATISEEVNNYDFNLAQNMKANAALRLSLLGEFMECESQQNSPVTELPPPMPSKPSVTAPLVPAPSDPFKPSLIKTLLEKIDFPGQHTYGYCKMFMTPKLNVRKEIVSIGDDRYYVEKILGKGAYGSVYKAYNAQNEAVALKIQKPPNKWEFYICREIQARLADHPLKDRFMDVRIGYFNDQASVLVSDFNPIGSLLDVANLVKQKQPKKKESLCLYICIEMLRLISTLHKIQIVHADVKPDNFLVQLRDNNTITLQLIDFGCSIDMAMFPPGTTFSRSVTTEDFVCCEMRDGRRWSYHTDLFCVAATAHVLLFEKYIQMQKVDGHWFITQKFPRYMKYDCWSVLFDYLLNQSATVDLECLISDLTSSLNSKGGDLNEEIRFLVNLLKGR